MYCNICHGYCLYPNQHSSVSYPPATYQYIGFAPDVTLVLERIATALEKLAKETE